MAEAKMCYFPTILNLPGSLGTLWQFLMSCRKISDTDCAGYFFGCAGQKTQGYVGYAEAF